VSRGAAKGGRGRREVGEAVCTGVRRRPPGPKPLVLAARVQGALSHRLHDRSPSSGLYAKFVEGVSHPCDTPRPKVNRTPATSL